MPNQIDLSLVDRVKNLLKITEEISLVELSDRLREFRNNTHPDGILDEALRSEAEERCKLANMLLDELVKQVEVERLSLTSSQLATYKPIYDLHIIQVALEKSQAELSDTKLRLEDSIKENGHLSDLLVQKEEKLVDKDMDYLQSLYKPSPKKFAALSIAVALPLAISVLAQMEKISAVLGKFSPFGVHYITGACFLAMICFLGVLIRELWQSRYINQRSEEVRSSEFALNLVKQMRPNGDGVSEFTEVDVFRFILGEKTRWKVFIGFLGFTIFKPQTINLLTNIALNNLLVKKLISPSRASKMQRYFSVIGEDSESDQYKRWWFNATKDKNDLEAQLTLVRKELDELKNK